MDKQKDSYMSQLAFLMALSRKGGGTISPSDVASAVQDYLGSHTASEDVAGVVKIGFGIKVDEDGKASIDEEFLAEMIADILNEQTEEISPEEISDLWD